MIVTVKIKVLTYLKLQRIITRSFDYTIRVAKAFISKQPGLNVVTPLIKLIILLKLSVW